MSPLDDELRGLLSARAGTVDPSPDPLAGIERRAGRMRRNRVVASVAGAALAVTAVAFGVPALVTDRDRAGGTQFATPSPSASPSPSSTRAPDALDPAQPWPYRGDSALLAGATLEPLRRDWSGRHPDSVLTPLYGHTYEPSGRPEIVFLSRAADGDRWGVGTTSAGGPAFLVDEPLPADTSVLMATLPGDEAPRLLVLAGPHTGEMSYALDGKSFHTRVGTDPGVAFIALMGDTSQDAVRVLPFNGDAAHPVFLGPAPDAPAGTTPPTGAPANALQWLPRGETPSADLMRKAELAFAQAGGDPAAQVTAKVLYAGSTSDGSHYVFFQAWTPGQKARTAGYEIDPQGAGTPFYGPLIGAEPPLLAFDAAGVQGKELLILLPRPGVGRVRYAPSSSAPFQDVASGRSSINDVALIDRDPKASSDRVEVHDGDDSILLTAPVMTLLCGASGCG